jgi:hypothetical protein
MKTEETTITAETRAVTTKEETTRVETETRAVAADLQVWTRNDREKLLLREVKAKEKKIIQAILPMIQSAQAKLVGKAEAHNLLVR